MEHVEGGMNSPLTEFRKINAWAAGAGTSAAFRRSALNITAPGSSGSSLSAKAMVDRKMDTSAMGYTTLS